LIKLPPEENYEEILSDDVIFFPSSSSSSSPSSSSTALNRLHDNERDLLLPSKQQQGNEESELDIGGWELFQNIDAILFCSLKFLIGGTGLMYINNVGAIIKTLYLSSNPHGDVSKEIQNFQNLHVALLSIFSCLGRISVGIISDLAKHKYNLRRLWFLLLACLYIFIGQILLGFITKDLKHLWIGTILIGFGYGNSFGISPTISTEWFGSRRFGLNW